ncbi:glycosyl hydrolase family 8 [Clostridium sp.]|uniref:glycosyl hydrolase family 8 n=1 Tax=Clostridium sp. TaxID=1506 RepID=UPI003F2E91A0
MIIEVIVIYKTLLTSKYSKEELTMQLVSFYNDWKKKYLRIVETSSLKEGYLFYTVDQATSNNAITCSEAMGYGMVIFPLMYKFDSEAEENFHLLYNFIKNHPSIYNKNLMAWQQVITEDGTIKDVDEQTSSATDGDIDISYRLIIANSLWRNDKTINYKGEALKRINALYDSCVDKTDYTLTLGDWVKGIENSTFKGVTRSSDFINYILWEFTKLDIRHTREWKLVIKKINSIINYQLTKESKDNGLMPDFFVKEGDNYVPPKKEVLETIHDGDYFFNSCRTPWRYSMDSILNKHPTPKQIKIQNNWIAKKTNLNPNNIVSGYYIINGTPGEVFGSPNDLSFISPFLVSSLLYKENPNWCLNLWNKLINTSINEANFYGNTLKLMAMIVATGNWTY